VEQSLKKVTQKRGLPGMRVENTVVARIGGGGGEHGGKKGQRLVFKTDLYQFGKNRVCVGDVVRGGDETRVNLERRYSVEKKKRIR